MIKRGRFHIKAKSLDALKCYQLALKQVFDLEERRTTQLPDETTEAVYVAIRRKTEQTLVITTDTKVKIYLPNITWKQFEMDNNTIFYGRGYDIFSH
ncbi:hypothetical protein J2Z48_000668 [Croceifilum oryzae]|uniref:Uncharacterized protein n=1 Tax=Croceifilum oryzae TaxID=1553429 RepID=A0AAJ1WT09_9BACL|nr:hypothetical protein [Croceifilum oryzae]MDQ0416501.1 hypothetical protein [Croceifilum oryzae]